MGKVEEANVSIQETSAVRTGKALHAATQPFASESRAKSWWVTVSTFVTIVVVLAGAGMMPWWPANAALSVVGGLLLVRGFILYHDFVHGAILRKSRVGKMLYYLCYSC